MKSPAKVVFWILTVVLSILVIMSHRAYPSFVEKLYQDKQFATLNQWAGITEEKSLDFYVGKIEDRWFGPITNTVYHLLFAAFCLLYLREAKRFQFWLGVFIFLIATKFKVLFYPFYGDAIGGPFAEGYWLSQNNFNFLGLAQQPGYNAGGPQVYLTTIYPAFLAVLLKLIPSTKIFLVVNHLIAFFLSAGIIAFMRQMLEGPLNKTKSVLASIILLSLPIFQSQTEAINMEIPCLFFSVMSILYLTRKEIGKAFIWALVALFVKGHGLVICGAVVFVTLCLFIFNGGYRKAKYLVYIALSLVIIAVKMHFTPNAISGLIQLFIGWKSLHSMLITKLFILSILLFMVCIFAKRLSFKSLLNEYFVHVIFLVTAAMWFGMFLNFDAVSPRYKLELAPFLLGAVILTVLNFIRIETLSRSLLIAAIFIMTIGSYGRWEPPLKTNYHVLSERSLEYRNELKLNQRIAQTIEQDFPGFTVGAPFIMAQILAIPQLGYVTKPLDVVVYGMPLTYGNVRNFNGLQELNLKKTVWIGEATQYRQMGDFTFPVGPHDVVLKHLEVGRNWAEIFAGGIAIEQMRMFAALKRAEMMKRNQKSMYSN
jgi:hypothetical protein